MKTVATLRYVKKYISATVAVASSSATAQPENPIRFPNTIHKLGSIQHLASKMGSFSFTQEHLLTTHYHTGVISEVLTKLRESHLIEALPVVILQLPQGIWHAGGSVERFSAKLNHHVRVACAAAS